MKTIKESVVHHFLFALLIIMFALMISHQVFSQDILDEPPSDNAPAFARWLVNQGIWGVLSTLDNDGYPFGNVVSYSDGGSGTPYFYLSFLDPTPGYAYADPRSSFTLSAYELDNKCNKKDPQSPVCAKITFSGKLKILEPESDDEIVARGALFKTHPQFRGFPEKNGSFSAYKLEIQSIFLVNIAAPPRYPSVKDYYNVKR